MPSVDPSLTITTSRGVVVEREQGAEALDNRQFLVVGGHDDRDERRHRDAGGQPAGAPRMPLSMPPQRDRREGAHRDLRHVPEHEVRGDQEREGDERVAPGKTSALSARLPQHLAREQAADVRTRGAGLQLD